MQAVPGWIWLALGLVLLLLVLLAALRKNRNKMEFEPIEEGRKPSVKLVLEGDKEVILDLFPDAAPNHVASFLKLSEDGFYNGLTFHRVVPGFVVQGGCPRGDGTGGPGYSLDAEFSDRQHLSGTLAMARSADPNSAGSQFYICLAPQPSLDRQYTVFGQVTDGFEHVQEIEKGDIIREIKIIS